MALIPLGLVAGGGLSSAALAAPVPIRVEHASSMRLVQYHDSRGYYHDHHWWHHRHWDQRHHRWRYYD